METTLPRNWFLALRAMVRMIFAERKAAHQWCMPQSAVALNSLSRYSGGGLGRGFWKSHRELAEDPHPNPPPEYRKREILSRSSLFHAPVPAQHFKRYAVSFLAMLLIVVSIGALSGCNRSTKSATTGKATF